MLSDEILTDERFLSSFQKILWKCAAAVLAMFALTGIATPARAATVQETLLEEAQRNSKSALVTFVKAIERYTSDEAKAQRPTASHGFVPGLISYPSQSTGGLTVIRP